MACLRLAAREMQGGNLLLVAFLAAHLCLAYASCGPDQFYGTSCYNNWFCRAMGGNATKFCNLFPKPSMCSVDACLYVDPHPANCLDETIVCKRGTYASGAEFRCSSYPETENSGMKPYLPESFDCMPCPFGFFCRGGATLKAIFYPSDAPVILGPDQHMPPTQCPFGNMAQKKEDASFSAIDFFTFPDPCDISTGVRSVYCDEQDYLRMICSNDESRCPCRCPEGSIFLSDASAPGGKTCACKAGTYWDKAANPKEMKCKPCRKGSYCPGGFKSEAVDCPADFTTLLYAIRNASQPKEDAPDAYFAVSNATKISDCVCSNVCASGYYCVAASSQLSPASKACGGCPKGYSCFNNAITPCGPGSFQDEEAQSKCKLCPAGTASSAVGSTTYSCAPCPPGSYQNSAGQSACTTCEPGFYQPAYSSTSSCKQCEPGKYQPSTGSSSCIQCPDGSSALPGADQRTSVASSCLLCAAGKYASLDASGNYQCVLCPEGKYNSQAGQSAPLVHFCALGARQCPRRFQCIPCFRLDC